MRTVSCFRPRILALWLPHLSTDRITRERRCAAPDEASGTALLVTVAKTENALRLVALNKRAARAGLFPGMALADARAMLPDLDVVEDDPEADRALLNDIALWCGRYTPLVALDAPHGLFLDIAGCAHLFGGEDGLVDDLLGRLVRAGFAATAAVAPTLGAAFALSRHGGGFIAENDISEVLAPLPLSALRLDPESVAAAGRLGLKRIDQLVDAPRAPLAARLGETLLQRLDQALGHTPEPISPLLPVPRFSAERRFIEPLALADGIAACLDGLASHIAAALERRGRGARRLELTLFGVASTRVSIAVGASRPLREAHRMAELLRERLAALAPRADKDTGFDVIRLSAPVTAPLDPVQTRIADDRPGGPDGEDLARLIDRLGARFGLRRIVRLSPLDSHIPEFAVAAIPAAFKAPRNGGSWPKDAAAEDNDAPARPVRLIEPPEPVDAIAAVPDGPPVRFSWRRMNYRVARAEGPERIAPEWWRGNGAHRTRDYYRVEDEDGRRFWLYRDGLYARETAHPRWFIHGLFA